MSRGPARPGDGPLGLRGNFVSSVLQGFGVRGSPGRGLPNPPGVPDHPPGPSPSRAPLTLVAMAGGSTRRPGPTAARLAEARPGPASSGSGSGSGGEGSGDGSGTGPGAAAALALVPLGPLPAPSSQLLALGAPGSATRAAAVPGTPAGPPLDRARPAEARPGPRPAPAQPGPARALCSASRGAGRTPRGTHPPCASAAGIWGCWTHAIALSPSPLAFGGRWSGRAPRLPYPASSSSWVGLDLENRYFVFLL